MRLNVVALYIFVYRTSDERMATIAVGVVRNNETLSQYSSAQFNNFVPSTMRDQLTSHQYAILYSYSCAKTFSIEGWGCQGLWDKL